ncbi:MAG TPA: hypothetical protein VN113_07420, partial [Caulobacter sp.]|nr:hypothetical protein [Caulobacter sp.]
PAGGEASCAFASNPTQEQSAMKAAAKAAAGETRDVNDVPWVKRKLPEFCVARWSPGSNPIAGQGVFGLVRSKA